MMSIDTVVVQVLERFFKQFGISYRRHDRTNLWLTRYFNFRLKYIPLGKRQFRVSKELSKKIPKHPNREALFDIFIKTSHGSDLNPYQSRASFNADYHDLLFNDWGIHHLHLSSDKTKPDDYFNIRTGDLVFVRFLNDVAYFLDIKHHNNANVWSDTDLIRIIQKNWNETIADKEVPNLKFDDYTDEEIGMLRKANVMFGFNVDDKSYLLFGHGQASSGDNLMAGRLADEVSRWIDNNEDLFRTDLQAFITELQKQLRM